MVPAPVRSGETKLYTGFGRQHAYWQLARWFGDLGIGRHNEYGGRCRHRRARNDRPFGRFIGRAIRRSSLRRLRSDAFRRRAQGNDDRRAGRRSEGTDGAAQGQRPGHRLRPAGVVYLQDRRGQEALLGGNQLRSSGSEHEKALELLLLAHQGRLDSRTLGGGQRPGRHDRT